MKLPASVAAFALLSAVCAGVATQTQSASADTPVVFVGASHGDLTWQTFESADVPAGTQVGDTLVMAFTHATSVAWSDPSGVTGWNQVDSSVSSSLTSTLWTKTVTAADLGATVRFDTTDLHKSMLMVADYTGADPAVVAASSADAADSTDHVSPVVSAPAGGLVASYWVNRSDATTTAWTTPAGTVQRDSSEGSGSWQYSSLLSDSGGPVAAGPYGGLTATTDAATSALSWTIALAPQGGVTNPPPPSSVTKLMVIWEENHPTSAYGGMPYLASLSDKYGKATGYSGLVHPSLGNYLAAVSGQGAGTCGLNDPLPAACPQSGSSVFGQAIRAGKTAGSYEESMSSNCERTNAGSYAARHNPWAYFTDETAMCQQGDVPLGSTTSGALLSDVRGGTLPNASLVTPNLLDDAHSGTLQQADSWLAQWMPVIMAGPDYQSGRLAIVITFDEGIGTDQTVPFVLVHPSVSHQVVSAPFDQYALCRLYDDVLGVPALNAAAGEPGLGAAFGL
jgi:phosphatidylinositol-3-phosphatase